MNRNDVTERMEDRRWSAKTNLLWTAGLCALLSWASYLGMPEGQAISSADRVARLVVWFMTPFLGALVLGTSLWLVVYATQFARGRTPSTLSLTAAMFRAARLITGVAGCFAVWYVVTRYL